MKTIEKKVLIQCPDIEVKLNLSKELISVLVILAAIILFIAAYCIQKNNNTVCNVFLVAGIITLFWGLHAVVSSKKLYYAPTHSRLCYFSSEVNDSNYYKLNSFLNNSDFLMPDEASLFCKYEYNFIEFLISADRNFVAISCGYNTDYYTNTYSDILVYCEEDAQKFADFVIHTLMKEKEAELCRC